MLIRLELREALTELGNQLELKRMLCRGNQAVDYKMERWFTQAIWVLDRC